MKYAAFSTQRTASSLINCMLANHFEVENLYDVADMIPPDIRGNAELRHAWLAEQLAKENYSVKLFSHNFAPNNYAFDKDTFDWTIFDKIICTTRRNVTDQMCSVYYMQPWINEPFNPLPVNTTPTEIDFSDTAWMAFLERMRNILIRFHQMKDDLLTRYPEKVSVVPTEIFTDPPSEFLPIVNSLTGIPFVESDLTPNNSIVLGLNWSEKYTNYNDLKYIVDSWNIPN
jgi:hypothetical protein